MKAVRLCQCEDGHNDPDNTGLCIDCHLPWTLEEGEVEDLGDGRTRTRGERSRAQLEEMRATLKELQLDHPRDPDR